MDQFSKAKLEELQLIATIATVNLEFVNSVSMFFIKLFKCNIIYKTVKCISK